MLKVFHRDKVVLEIERQRRKPGDHQDHHDNASSGLSQRSDSDTEGDHELARGEGSGENEEGGPVPCTAADIQLMRIQPPALVPEAQEDVEVRQVMAQMVNAVYGFEAYRRRQQRENGTRKRDDVKRAVAQVLGSETFDEEPTISQEEFVARLQRAGFQLKTAEHCQPGQGPYKIWFLVFVKDSAKCTCRGAPEVVVAVRGTMISVTDLRSDLKVLRQKLHDDGRYEKLLQVVENEVLLNGHENVCITGHSLGAALGLLVGKVMAAKHTPVDGHFFNPPFASFTYFDSSLLRRLERDCKLLLLTSHMAMNYFHDDYKGRKQWLLDSHTKFWSVMTWTPHLYLNKSDTISKGYINFFQDIQGINPHFNSAFLNWQAELSRPVAHLTLSSLMNTKKLPNHLLPSAIIIFSPPPPWSKFKIKTVMRSHTVSQWLNYPCPLERAVIQVRRPE